MYKAPADLAVRIVTWLLLVASACTLLLATPMARSQTFLEPERAFHFSAYMLDANTAEVRFRIADGYYMYRERFAFSVEGARLGAPLIPAGEVKYDKTFEKDVETHRGTLSIRLPVEAASAFSLHVTSQGCSDEGLCYAPIDSQARLDPAVIGVDGAAA